MKIKKLKLFKGFTLIELLVVIAIIGILASIVYAPFQTARRKGRDAQKIIEMKNLLATISLYADSHAGAFPETMIQLRDSQTDPLPLAVNYTNAYAPNGYNYQPFYSQAAATGTVVGFHLWTHLETANAALAGAAKCDGMDVNGTLSGGFSGTVIADACLHVSQGSTISSNVPGAIAASTITGNPPKFTSTQRGSSDTDKVCATDVTSCILDYRQ